jgi:hypothetical protein
LPSRARYAELWHESSERIWLHVGRCAGGRAEEAGLAGIGKADKADVSNNTHEELNRELLAGRAACQLHFGGGIELIAIDVNDGVGGSPASAVPA